MPLSAALVPTSRRATCSDGDTGSCQLSSISLSFGLQAGGQPLASVPAFRKALRPLCRSQRSRGSDEGAGPGVGGLKDGSWLGLYHSFQPDSSLWQTPFRRAASTVVSANF